MLSTNSEQPKKSVDYSFIVRKSCTRCDCWLYQAVDNNFGNEIGEEKNYVGHRELCYWGRRGMGEHMVHLWIFKIKSSNSSCRFARRLLLNVMPSIDRIRDKILLFRLFLAESAKNAFSNQLEGTRYFADVVWTQHWLLPCMFVEIDGRLESIEVKL